MDDIAAFPRCSLSSLDWKVVDLARRDGRRSLLLPGRIARMARALFGWPMALRWPIRDWRRYAASASVPGIGI